MILRHDSTYIQLWYLSPGAAVTAERRVGSADANAASSSAAEEQDPQKHAEELANNWIDRILTPAIQKQVCCAAAWLVVYPVNWHPYPDTYEGTSAKSSECRLSCRVMGVGISLQP